MAVASLVWKKKNEKRPRKQNLADKIIVVQRSALKKLTDVWVI